VVSLAAELSSASISENCLRIEHAARLHQRHRQRSPSNELILLKPGPLDSSNEIMAMRAQYRRRHAQLLELFNEIPRRRWRRRSRKAPPRWWNGVGYPTRPESESILRSRRASAQVFAVIAHDALTNERPYCAPGRNKLAVEQDALERALSGDFDPEADGSRS
jgi:response regulator RpfG family c-di-GMP phosphodiesterase